MPRFIGPKTKKQHLAGLEKKVNKNTRILARREIGRIRVDMDSTPDTTAVVQNISFIQTGDDVSQRQGRKIHAESISVSGSVRKAATSTGATVRMIIFRDNLGTTTAPTFLWPHFECIKCILTFHGFFGIMKLV